MSLNRLVIISLWVFCFSTLSNADDKPRHKHQEQFQTIVNTQYGKVQGTLINDFNVVAYKGIPYAKPPVDNLRWQAPRNPEPWKGIRDASEFGDRCFQGFSGTEDCLYLNIWRPVKKSYTHRHREDYEHSQHRRHLPVFVWIHGGSNTSGSGNGSWYTVADAYDAIVVSINYRLGFLGWFSHPALKSGNLKNDSGNFGTLDQIKALTWIKQNIQQFGGDPNNITLAGESAGAQNVSYLMHTPLAKDLFNKTIIESNFPGIRPVSAAYKSSKQVLYNLLVADGLAGNTETAKVFADNMTDLQTQAYFYSKEPVDFANAYYNGFWGSINWGDFYREDIISGDNGVLPPVVQQAKDRPEFVYAIGDGHVLPDDIDFADFTKGNVYPKPMIVGTTKNENNLWNGYWPYNFRGNTPLTDLVNEAITGSNPFLTGTGTTATEFKSNYKFGTELIDEVTTYLGAHLSARNMSNAYPEVPVYVYRFDWASSLNKDYKIPNEGAWKFYMGSIHGAELDFFYQKFFGLENGGIVTDYTYTDENLEGRQKLSLAIKSYLRKFIRNRDGFIRSTSKQPIKWKPWRKQNERFIVFDADYNDIDVKMNNTDLAREPQALFNAHAHHSNEVVRDFIEYYIMWSWHWNWYPNASSADPFDTSPGPNILFDPNNP